MISWRIATDAATYAADDASGEGAKRTGGRWNSIGLPMLYTSSSIALAALETIVHLSSGGLPLNRYLVRVEIPDAIWDKRMQEAVLDDPGLVGWDAAPASATSIRYGDLWLRSARSALLCVPSVIVPEEPNILINPLHPDSHALHITKVRKLLYDPRLTGL